MSRTVVFTVIFPGNLPFLENFIDSLNSQTATDFDVLVANDGVINPEQYLRKLQKPYSILPVSGSPAAIRQLGIAYLANSTYQHVIFSDSDDMQTANRIEVCVELLKENALVCNDLDLINQHGEAIESGYWAGRLPEGFVFTADFLIDKNVAGLGNTAVRTEALRNLQPIPAGLSAPDWFLFYQIAFRYRGVFTSQCRSRYRQHAQNTIGLNRVNQARLFTILTVRQQHYQALLAAGFKVQARLENTTHLARELEKSADRVDDGLVLLNGKMLNYFWWEETNYLE